MKPSTTSLTTDTGRHQLDLKLADSFLSRFKGLMLSAPLQAHQGLLITHCPSVHCAFMRYAIDVVYLDGQGKVTRCVSRLKPWHASASNAGKDSQGKRHVRAIHTLELAAGTIERLSIRPGDQLAHAHWQAQQAATPLQTLLQPTDDDQQRTTP